MRYRCVINHNGDEKYILGRITNHVSKTTDLIIVSSPHRYHSMIHNNFQSSLSPNERFDVLGGGILTIDKENKTIKTYGQSGGYGPPDRELVECVLQQTMGKEGYTLEVTVTDYIRD